MDAQLCKDVASNVGVKSANSRQRLCSQSFQLCRRACTKSAKSQQGHWRPSCALSLQLAADGASNLLVRSKTRTLMPTQLCRGSGIKSVEMQELGSPTVRLCNCKKSKNVDPREVQMAFDQDQPGSVNICDLVWTAITRISQFSPSVLSIAPF